MIDSATQKVIRVSSESPSGPYIMLSVAAVAGVRQILEENGVPFWVDHTAVSVNGRPALTFVNIGKKVDPQRVQALLDAVA